MFQSIYHTKKKWLPNLESVFRMVFQSTLYTEDMKSLLGGETGGTAADRQKHVLKGTQGDGLSARERGIPVRTAETEL